MELKIHVPEKPLDDYIDHIIYYTGYNPAHHIEKLLPDGKINLIIALDEIDRFTFDPQSLNKKNKCVNTWIAGMQKEYICFSAAQHSRMLVVQFKPSGAYPFFQLPLTELTDLVVDADLILGKELLFLREKILDQHHSKQIFPIVIEWLSNRIAPANHHKAIIDFAVSNIHFDPSQNCLKKIAQKTGYSQKQFIHIFKKFVGLTPKQYQKITRFNRALSEIENQQQLDWTKISYDCGYYDQAHFINEFQNFSGFSPSRYLTERGEFLNYIPIFSEK